MRTTTLLLFILATLSPFRLMADPVPPPPSDVHPPSASTGDSTTLQPTNRKVTIINEFKVYKLDGTIMAQHEDGTDPTPLATGSVVEKGDVVTVYDGSWVILKSRRGDKIGFDGNSLFTLDECFFEGPDRQVRFIMKHGTMLLETNGDDSRQSFFEIYTGKVVTSINNIKAIIHYDDAKDVVDIKYIEGKIHVIDQTHEETFRTEQTQYNGYTHNNEEAEGDQGEAEEHTEHSWVAGKMSQDDPIPMDEIDELNYRRFFDGEPRVAPSDNNMLLDDSQRVPFRQR